VAYTGGRSRKGNAMGSFGVPELLIVLGIVLLLFGAKKLPDLARSLGKSTKEFKKGLQEGETDRDPVESTPDDKSA
jgi:sec-independent protein translocase protein TatA